MRCDTFHMKPLCIIVCLKLFFSGYISCLPFAEAPCKHVVELARVEVTQHPSPSEAMRDFARILPTNAEKGTHRVLRKHDLVADVDIHEANLGEGILQKFPYIPTSAWMQYLMDSGRLWRQMVGVPSFRKMKLVLREYWSRFQAIRPGHKVFELAQSGALVLERCIPIFSHSDEGRSYKHLGLFVLSVAGAVGRGTRPYLNSNQHRNGISSNQMGLNFTGRTWSTQFMHSCMIKTVYDSHPQAQDGLVRLFAEDLAKLLRDGIMSKDGRRHVWFVHLGHKGDLPALAKMGQLKRSFSHVPRAASSKRPCSGICHLCKAGFEDFHGPGSIPFEDMSPSALWVGTLYQEPAWDALPTVVHGLPWGQEDMIRMFCTDLWHNVHLGVSKHFVGSACVSIIECASEFPECPRGSIEAKFGWLTGLYQAHFRTLKVVPYIPDISRESMQWPMSSKCPCAKWSKGLAATQLMQFLGAFSAKYIDGRATDPLLISIAPLLAFQACLTVLLHARVSLVHWFARFAEAAAAKAINLALGHLYRSGYWIPKEEAMMCGKLLFSFLQHYAICADITLRRGKARFALSPKHHMVAHAAHSLLTEGERAEWAESPLAHSNQIQEDFIGRPCRLSRRVHTRNLHRSVLLRSLIVYLLALKQADSDQRGMDAYAL